MPASTCATVSLTPASFVIQVKRVLVSTLRKNPIRLTDMHELFSLFGQVRTQEPIA